MRGKKMMPPVPVPGATPWDRFAEFAKRIITVPKSEVPTKRKPKKSKRR